ncbi:M50 family metallopeptidase [Bacillus sp. RG28]|uniref:M50 family metallopeptidase n=1 Tax=Gottfriedia endophytica TaxID=2820819 RepID=A0A940NS42_9BACI|nr:M50 family metallopeptidase [Gottfriedia endophytica]MBP0723883.1 M50 family metallopeptidase [Gottfriedia endophytica]
MNKWSALFTKIKIHPLYWLIAGIGLITASFWSVIFLTIIIFVHELGHALVATFFNWRINKVVLLPFGGVVDLDEHGNRPLLEEFLVTIAGPFQHFLLYLAAFFLYKISILPQNLYELFLFHNLCILCFNLFPIWPLDGGKILYQLFLLIFPFAKAHEVNLYCSFIFLFLGVFFTLLLQPVNLTAWVCISFLFVSLLMEWKHRHFIMIRFLMERFYGKKAYIQKIKSINVSKDMKLYEVFSRFQKGYKHNVVFSTNPKNQMTLDENELLHAYFTEKRVTSTMEELVS